MSITQVTSYLGTVANADSGRGYLDNLTNKVSLLKPKSVKGIGGFVFDYEGETSVTYNADITDHYTEENVFINDHIAIKPARIVLKGFISELKYKKPAGILGALEFLGDKMTALPAYLGGYTPQVTQNMFDAISKAQSVVTQIDGAIKKAQNIIGMFPNSSVADTAQKKAFDQLYSMFSGKQVFSLKTPYKIYPSVAIETLTFVQNEDDKYTSDISVTVKEVRFAEVVFSKTDSANYAKKTAAQKASLADNGKTKGTEKPVSLLSSGGAGLLNLLKK